MNGPNETKSSHLFILRLWSEEDEEGNAEWCGKVQHVITGQAQPFRTWPSLVDLLREMLTEDS